jgi:NAD(P)-dependent dehydrogenase (short-subunit alcohol dehydrogenase family)
MKIFNGKTAVITGAASGIGFALAQQSAKEKMRVVMADKNLVALEAAAAQVRALGAEVLAAQTDVSRGAEVMALAEATRSSFGAAHCLFNNAGVGIVTPILRGSDADWEWALGVNLWGAIYGVRAFVPLMREQGDECHIVNTASIAGLISPPGLGIYRTTKFAIVGFSEALRHELAEHAPRIKVSVLCPGMVRTEILQSAYRERESHQKDRDEKEEQRLRHVMQDAMPAEQVATLTFDALRRDAFYILTHPERNLQIKLRFEEILGA